jgi:hypothetical protein
LQHISSSSAEALYVLDLARLPQETVGSTLLKDLVRYIRDACSKNHAIKVVGTWAFTDAGSKLADRLGMTQQHTFDDYANTCFYELDTAVLKDPQFRQHPVLADILSEPFVPEYQVNK